MSTSAECTHCVSKQEGTPPYTVTDSPPAYSAGRINSPGGPAKSPNQTPTQALGGKRQTDMAWIPRKFCL